MKLIAMFCNRARSDESSCANIQARSHLSAAQSVGTIDGSGGRYGTQPTRFSRSSGLRRLVAWTRSIAPPTTAPQVHIQTNNFVDSRMSSTSAPVSCKESNIYMFVHCRSLKCFILLASNMMMFVSLIFVAIILLKSQYL